MAKDYEHQGTSPAALFWMAMGCVALITIVSQCSKKGSEPDGASTSPEQATQLSETEVTNPVDQILEDELKWIIPRTKKLIALPTFREKPGETSGYFRQNMEAIRDNLFSDVALVNSKTPLKIAPLRTFEWRAQENPDKWVFGVKLGNGPKRLALIAHLDTVPANAGPGTWKPFTPHIETRELAGKQTTFLVGRGAVDDKGPAAALFTVMVSLAKNFEQFGLPLEWTIELVLDTSEETGMSIHHYYADTVASGGEPTEGLVLDANWCVFAEKGVARPTFTQKLKTKQSGDCWISKIATPEGPVNQIADEAHLEIHCAAGNHRDDLVAGIDKAYHSATFDDPKYRKAKLKAMPGGPNESLRPNSLVEKLHSNGLRITALVAGAQHGSVPDMNRQNGANPLVSLLNFASWLQSNGFVGSNDLSDFAHFVERYWGTDVSGKVIGLWGKSPIFIDGTTYALTRMSTDSSDAVLKIDVRYTDAHHTESWPSDGDSGTSVKSHGHLKNGRDEFSGLFDMMVKYHPEISYENPNIPHYPDLKNVNTPLFKSMQTAYGEVFGKLCEPVAIGGGTDAHGHDNLLASGPLHNIPGVDTMGPPINYHGLDEAVPVSWLHDAARVYYKTVHRRLAAP